MAKIDDRIREATRGYLTGGDAHILAGWARRLRKTSIRAQAMVVMGRRCREAEAMRRETRLAKQG